MRLFGHSTDDDPVTAGGSFVPSPTEGASDRYVEEPDSPAFRRAMDIGRRLREDANARRQ